MRTKKEGFTLVELMVVVSIIALLLALLMPSLSRAREGAKRQVCANQLKQNSVAIHSYGADYDYKMPWWGYDESTVENPYAGDEEGHPYVVYRGGSTDIAWRFPTSVATDPWDTTKGKLKAMRMACLYEGKYITVPEVFYCPSNRMPLYKFESYTDPTPWGRLPQVYNSSNVPPSNQWVRLGYEYFPTDPKTPTESLVYGSDTYNVPKETARKVHGLNPHLPYMTDVIRNRTHLSHQNKSTYAVHALFSDGHVVFCNDAYVFNHPVWANPPTNWRLYYYIIFRQINP